MKNNENVFKSINGNEILKLLVQDPLKAADKIDEMADKLKNISDKIRKNHKKATDSPYKDRGSMGDRVTVKLVKGN